MDLVSCVVHEVECARDVAGFSGHVLQLMYAMALTRWVWLLIGCIWHCIYQVLEPLMNNSV